MDVRNLGGRLALVTGAGSGIGRASALAFAERGADLALCDVAAEPLAETAKRARAMGRSVLERRVDVADRAAMAEFADVVAREAGVVDLLMNNAGVGLGASFEDTSLADWDWIVGINLLGVVHGCHYFLPPMRRRAASEGRPAHVVNVSSAAGYLPSEVLSAYTTTKYAVLGLSEALRIELRPLGIGVTAICPGIIDTGITQSSPLRGKADVPGAREQMVALYRRRGYTPERVARGVLRAVQRNRAVAPVSPEAWAAYYLKRLWPAAVYALSRLGNRSRPAPPG